LEAPLVCAQANRKQPGFEDHFVSVYTLSLYVVNKTINDQWQEWFEREIFGGLPMPPDKSRLDSVRLVLGK
jgi:hypothetical protein